MLWRRFSHALKNGNPKSLDWIAWSSQGARFVAAQHFFGARAADAVGGALADWIGQNLHKTMGVKTKLKILLKCLVFPQKIHLTISYLLEFLNRGLYKVNIPKSVSNGGEKTQQVPCSVKPSLNTWIISWIASGEFFHEVWLPVV